MANIHDSGYKMLFSNKVIFRELIETFVHEKWVKDIDFDSCETIDKSFISDHYKETESDLIYRARLKGEEIYIVVLLEFQSTVDHFMALRILNYITNFYMDYVQSTKDAKSLPAVFPILLYNGDARWTAPVSLSNLIEHHDLIGDYAPHFTYFKIVENDFSKEALLRIKNIVTTLFLAEAHFDIELLKSEFMELLKTEEDKQAISLFLNWFKQLWAHGRMEKSDYSELERVYKTTEEVKEMLITALERDRKELFQKGRLEGKLEGRLEGKYLFVRNMLAEGLEISLISRVTGLDEDDIKDMKTISGDDD